MTLLEAVVLGVLQGATEFLPVSSSGHLVVGQALMGLDLPGVFFEVAVHVATLVSVLFVYRHRVYELLRGAARRDGEAWGYLGLLILATMPAAVVGILFEGRVEALFESTAAVAVAFLLTGGLLWTSRRALAREPGGRPGVPQALLMGMAQAFALVPGISRSGTTVVVGLWCGVETERAAEFSFLMAVPAIGGAALLQVPELMAHGAGVDAGSLVVGTGVAGITGILAIWSFVALLRKKAFHLFAPYLWVLGLGLLAWLYLG